MNGSSPTCGIATSGHSAISGTSGNRSGVAKAVRGSMTVMSKPAMRAIGASAWLIWTAPITTSRGGGSCTVRKASARLLAHSRGAGAEPRREFGASGSPA